METPKRYHAALVTVHWLMALLIFANLYLGIVIFERPPQGFAAFRALNPLVAIHMITGLTILALLLIRFIIRIRTKHPATANAENKFLDILSKVVHYGLYVTVLVVTLLGLIFSLQSGRFQTAFLGAQDRFNPRNGNLPAFQGTPGAQGFPNGNGQNFQGGQNDQAPGGNNFPGGPRPNGGNFRPGRGGFPLMIVHEWAAYLLLFLITVHILGWAYHQFIRRDHLFARIWYGQS